MILSGKISHFSNGEAGMGLPRSNDGEARFSAYVEELTRDCAASAAT